MENAAEFCSRCHKNSRGEPFQLPSNLGLVASQASNPDLTTNLARPMQLRMNIGVSRFGAKGADQFTKLSGAYALKRLSKHLFRGDRSRHRALGGAFRREGSDQDGRWGSGRLAEPDHYATDRAGLPKVDMGLSDGSFQPTKGELIINDFRRIVESCREGSAGLS